MFSLWCAGILGTCNIDTAGSQRFHFTCLYCRLRREFYGKWIKPRYYINYTYVNYITVKKTKRFVRGNYEYTASNGGYLTVTDVWTLKIDPRGHFTRLRCCAIIVIDKMLKYIRRKDPAAKTGYLRSSYRPWVEVCEFLCNYP